MKRGRISRTESSNPKRGRNINGNSSHLQIHYSGPSFSDLSKDIMINIFLRLFVKSIFVCKSVCKTWYDLISDSEFSKLHYDKNEVHPLIHASEFKSEMLYLVQPEKDDFERKLNMCNHTYSNPGCVCNVKVTLDTKFDLPSPGDNALPPNKKGYRVVNSCNGLLCLFNQADKRSYIICNPITGEFVDLPEAKNAVERVIRHGFGYSYVSNQYKVVRINYRGGLLNDGIWKDRVITEVQTVGTESWREIEYKLPYFMCDCPVYFNGFLYWVLGHEQIYLISFDIENESFRLELGPEVDISFRHSRTISVGVLGKELCVSGMPELKTLHVWAMKDDGVKKIWSKIFSFDMRCLRGPCYEFRPLKYLDDGSMMMFYSHSNSLVHIDPKKCTFRFLKIRGKELKVKALVAHIPSIVLLKHSLAGHNVKVHNIQSRCGELKLHKHINELQMIEDEFSYYEQGHCSYYI